MRPLHLFNTLHADIGGYVWAPTSDSLPKLAYYNAKHKPKKKTKTNRYWNLTSVYKGEVAAETLLEAARSDPGLDFVTLGYGIGHAFALQGNMSAAFVRH